MPREPSAVAPRPLVYAGRFADRVRAADLPADCTVLDDWQVLPSRLAAAMEGATTLVVLDLFSFPFEAMTERQRDVPLVVVPPPGFDAGFLEAVFGVPLFATLGPLDRVATPDAALWEKLRQTYGWLEGQRVALEDDDPGSVARGLCARLAGETVPDKATFKTRAAALGPRLVAASGGRAADVPFDVLEVGAVDGRWAFGLDGATTRFFGLGLEGAPVPEDLPGGRFGRAGEDLAFPHADEAFDLAFTVSVLHHHPVPAKEAIVSEMWRVLRPGGRLAFLEDFVTGRGAGGPAHVISVQRFVEVVLEATAGRVVLEHFEAVRYTEDPFFRGGVMVLSKIGTPRAW